MADSFKKVAERIDGYRSTIVQWEQELTAIQALDPDSGGDGEARKAEKVLEILAKIGITEVEVYKAPDERVSAGYRPSIVARIPGKDHTQRLWLMSHMDVVPAGELKDWASDPWEAKVEGNKIFGRGVEDNQQGLVSSLCLAKAVMEEGVELPRDLCLLFVADEETGNDLGINYLLENHSIFNEQDLIVVPDGGESDGSMIEVAEKGILWLKCTVKGKQTHGSTPDRGINAHSAAAHLIVKLEQLYSKFDQKRRRLRSTHKHLRGHQDRSRRAQRQHPARRAHVLHGLPGDAGLRAGPGGGHRRGHGQGGGSAPGTSTVVSSIQRQDAAPPTPVDAPVVRALERAVKAVYEVEARPMGIGGGTVAAYIRKKGFNAAVWARMDETMHGPNEYCIIDNLVGDAKVFAYLLLS